MEISHKTRTTRPSGWASAFSMVVLLAFVVPLSTSAAETVPSPAPGLPEPSALQPPSQPSRFTAPASASQQSPAVAPSTAPAQPPSSTPSSAPAQPPATTSTPEPAPPATAPSPAPAQPPAPTPPQGPGSAAAPIPPPPQPTYPPPSAYPPPPDYYPPSYSPPQYRRWGRVYTQEDEEHGVFRPLSLTLAVGPGMLIGPGERDVALSYNIFRLGIGIIRNLSFIISYEGAGTNSTNPETGEDSWLSQNQWIFGLQFHFLRWFYVRAGVGPGSIEETTRHFYFSNGTSLTYAGALGLEFLQTEYLALGFEASASTTHYSHESWQTIGWDLTLAFY